MIVKRMWKLDTVEVALKPVSRAHATVFWFLSGKNPARVMPAIEGAFTWTIPDLCSGKMQFARGYDYLDK